MECAAWHSPTLLTHTHVLSGWRKLSKEAEQFFEVLTDPSDLFFPELQAHPTLQRADAAARWTPGHGSRSEFLATGERVLHWLRRFVYFGGRVPSRVTGRTEIYDASSETPSLVAMT